MSVTQATAAQLIDSLANSSDGDTTVRKVEAYNGMNQMLDKNSKPSDKLLKYVYEQRCKDLIRAIRNDVDRVSHGGDEKSGTAALKLLGRLLNRRVYVTQYLTQEQYIEVFKFLRRLIGGTERKQMMHIGTWCLVVQKIGYYALERNIVKVMSEQVETNRFSSVTICMTLLEAFGAFVCQAPKQMTRYLALWGTTVCTRLLDDNAKIREKAETVVKMMLPLVQGTLVSGDATDKQQKLGGEQPAAQRRKPSGVVAGNGSEDAEEAASVPDEFHRSLYNAILTKLLPRLKRAAQEETRLDFSLRVFGYFVVLLGPQLHDNKSELLNKLLDLPTATIRCDRAAVRRATFEAWRLLIDNFAYASNVFDALRDDTAALLTRVEKSSSLRDTSRTAADCAVKAIGPSAVSYDPNAVYSFRVVLLLIAPLLIKNMRSKEERQVREASIAAWFHLCVRLGADRLAWLGDLVLKPMFEALHGHALAEPQALARVPLRAALQLLRIRSSSASTTSSLPSSTAAATAAKKKLKRKKTAAEDPLLDALLRMQPLHELDNAVCLARVLPPIFELLRSAIENAVAHGGNGDDDGGDDDDARAQRKRKLQQAEDERARVASGSASGSLVHDQDVSDRRLLTTRCCVEHSDWRALNEHVQQLDRLAARASGTTVHSSGGAHGSLKRRASCVVDSLIDESDSAAPVAQVLLLWYCVVRRCARALPVASPPRGLEVHIVQQVAQFPFDERAFADVNSPPLSAVPQASSLAPDARQAQTRRRLLALRCAMLRVLGQTLGAAAAVDALSLAHYALCRQSSAGAERTDTLASSALRRMLRTHEPPCVTMRYLLRRATHTPCVKGAQALRVLQRVERRVSELGTARTAALLWSEIAVRHVALLKRDHLCGATLSDLLAADEQSGATPTAAAAADNAFSVHFQCLLSPLARVFGGAEHDSLSEFDALQVHECERESAWLGAWSQLYVQLAESAQTAHGVAGADKLLQRLCARLERLPALAGALGARLLAPSQLKVLAALFDTIVKRHNLSLMTSNERSSSARVDPLVALARVCARALASAHHSSFLRADTGARLSAARERVKRLERQVASGNYAPLQILGAAQLLVKSTRSSREMFRLLDELNDALALWLEEPRPSAAALAAVDASDGVQSKPHVLDSNTCEQLASGTLQLWEALLECVKRNYKAVWDTEVLARISPTLVPGFATKHRNIKDTTLAFWTTTFARASRLVYPERLRCAVAPLADRVALPGLNASLQAPESQPHATRPVTNFESVAKRKLESKQSRSKRRQNDTAAGNQSKKRSLEFVDKSGHSAHKKRLPPPTRNHSLQFDGYQDSQYVQQKYDEQNDVNTNNNNNNDDNDNDNNDVEATLALLDDDDDGDSVADDGNNSGSFQLRPASSAKRKSAASSRLPVSIGDSVIIGGDDEPATSVQSAARAVAVLRDARRGLRNMRMSLSELAKVQAEVNLFGLEVAQKLQQKIRDI